MNTHLRLGLTCSNLNNHFMYEVARALTFESTYSAFVLVRLHFKNDKNFEKYCS